MRIRSSAIVVAAFVAFMAAPARSVEPPRARPTLADVEDTIRRVMEHERIPGMVVGFANDSCTWVRAYGYSDLENHVDMRPDASFRLASVQKTMTAVAVLQLVEQGRLDLDAPIQTYVPYYPRKRWDVTARQLLSHLGGIPHYVDREREQHFKTHFTTRQAIAVFENFPLESEPGTTYHYSSYGYDLLGAAIEGASGTSYADYMREHVWHPARMEDTRMDDPLAIIPRRVCGYQIVDSAVVNSEFVDVSSRFAAGGTRGTVADLLKFMKALGNGTLLQPRGEALMRAPAHDRANRPVPYAMGWQIPPFRDRGEIVTNDGGQQETRTFILWSPRERFCMALAMNLEADVYGPIVTTLFGYLAGRALVIER